MTYEQHQIRSHSLSPPDLNAILLSLGRDERFGAVVGWLERNRETFINGGSRQEISSDHGKLAHAAGSVHAVSVLMAQLAALLSPQPAQGGEPKPEDV